MVEKAGVAIKKLLQRSDPFKSRKCERGDWPVCREDEKGPCDRQCVTYDIKCTECNDIYSGAPSRAKRALDRASYWVRKFGYDVAYVRLYGLSG